MRKMDINGNTVSTNAEYCTHLIANMTSGTYHTDDHGRIMVDTGDGGYIVFFEQDRPKTVIQVEGKLKHVKKWGESALGEARNCAV